jgi:Fur family ferric uptake transcriptional regulator
VAGDTAVEGSPESKDMVGSVGNPARYGHLWREQREPLPPDADSADLAARLREVGQRVTPQRMLILGAFTPGAHLTADEVYAHVERFAPAVNRSTVYRTLELFRDLGLISETDLGGGVRHYELLAGARHHHLICLECGAMLTLDDALVQPLRDAVRARYEFSPCIDHLALFGRCSSCESASRRVGKTGSPSEGS